MRHLWSLLAGVVAAPLAWLCLAAGQHQSSQTVAEWTEANLFDTAELIGPAAFLVAAGILLGLVATLRWSPAGPLVAGLLFAVPAILMFIDPFRTLDAFSVDRQRVLLDQEYQPWLPLQNGTALLLGVLLLMAVFSAQRWRRWPAAAGAGAAATGIAAESAAPVSDQPAPEPMTDDEILAAAAAMEEAEKAGATAAVPKPAEPAEVETVEAESAEPESAEPEAAKPEAAAEPAEPSPEPEATEEPDHDKSSARSGTSAKG